MTQIEDGTFLVTSPALNGFLVQADTLEEVLVLAPGIAKALVEAMREKGISPDLEVEFHNATGHFLPAKSD